MKHALAIAFIFVSCKRSTSDAPSPGTASGSETGATVVTTPVDAAGSDARTDSAVDAADLDASPGVDAVASAGANERVIAVTEVKGALVGVVAGPAPAAGTRLAVFGDRGKLCDAVVGAPPPDCVRGNGVGRDVAPLLTLQPDGACANPLYALPAGQQLTTVTVKAASATQQEAATQWFDAGPFAVVNEAVVLNGLDEQHLPTLASTRMLVAPGLREIMLLYVTGLDTSSRRYRTIHVLKPDPSATQGRAPVEAIGEVDAPAPSRVVGAELDGDGTLDVIVSHATGAAMLLSGDQPSVQVTCR